MYTVATLIVAITTPVPTVSYNLLMKAFRYSAPVNTSTSSYHWSSSVVMYHCCMHWHVKSHWFAAMLQIQNCSSIHCWNIYLSPI